MKRHLLTVVALAFAQAANAQSFNAAPPNAATLKPAFAEQTRAPEITEDLTLAREVIVSGLRHPWGLDQLPNGSWIVTERVGRMRIVSPQGDLSAPIRGLPEVDARRQGACWMC